MNKFMTATDARKKFYAIIQMVKRPGTHVIITHEGLPKVAMVSFEEFEEWKEKITSHSKKM